MPNPALTPLGLLIVALLAEDDMHPYEMMRMLRQRREDRLVTITNGTFYHTVARLLRDGLIAEAGVDRDGNRPERTTYSVTEHGVASVAEWVRRELPRAGRDAEYRVALAESHNLPREDVLDALAERRDHLAAEREAYAAELAAAAEHHVPEQFLIESERALALLDADLAWTDRLRERLVAGELAWGIPELDPDALRDLRRTNREAANA